MGLARSVALFIAAGLAEIGGGYLVWRWLRDGAPIIVGILGAAIAWGASIIVDNVAAMVELRWVLGLAPFGPGYGLVAAVTAGCFGATGIAARALLGETLPALAVALAVGIAAFAAVLYAARAPLQLAVMAAAFRVRAAPARARQPGQRAA